MIFTKISILDKSFVTAYLCEIIEMIITSKL